MLKVGVVGATGYAGEEVIKILVGHKLVKVTELSAVKTTSMMAAMARARAIRGNLSKALLICYGAALRRLTSTSSVRLSSP